MSLSKLQIDTYHEQGYLVIQDVLPGELVAELNAVTDDFVEQSRALTQNDAVFDLEPNHSAERPRLRRIKNPADVHAIYRRVLELPEIVGMLDALIGPGVRYNGHKLNMKEGDGGSKVEWHQDIAFYPHSNDDVLAVAVAMNDMTEANGCLMVAPGSHRGPIYSHHRDGRFVGAITNHTVAAHELHKAELAAGGICIFHGRIIHGSTPNRSSQPRRLLINQYAAADAWPLMGVPDWDAFNRCLLTGAPTFAPRLESIPIHIPLPLEPQLDSIFVIQDSIDQPLATATS